MKLGSAFALVQSQLIAGLLVLSVFASQTAFAAAPQVPAPAPSADAGGADQKQVDQSGGYGARGGRVSHNRGHPGGDSRGDLRGGCGDFADRAGEDDASAGCADPLHPPALRQWIYRDAGRREYAGKKRNPRRDFAGIAERSGRTGRDRRPDDGLVAPDHRGRSRRPSQPCRRSRLPEGISSLRYPQRWSPFL